jgi:hypothetical protein
LKNLVTMVIRATLVGTVPAVGMGAATAPSASAASSFFSPPGQAAVFVQTDDPAGNQIVAYARASNGALGDPQAYNTGGDGAVTSGSAVDPLASQGSLVLANGGRALLAVNAGSDTVSVFRVFGGRLVLSQVVASGGEFPASIAVHRDLVYVLNSGGAGSLQGFSFFSGHLVPLWGSNRSLGLSNTSPPFFLDSPGQVGFTPDGQQLIITTKNSGSVGKPHFAGLLRSAATFMARMRAVPTSASSEKPRLRCPTSSVWLPLSALVQLIPPPAPTVATFTWKRVGPGRSPSSRSARPVH